MHVMDQPCYASCNKKCALDASVAAVIKVSLLLCRHIIMAKNDVLGCLWRELIFQEFTENSLLTWAVQKKIPNFFFYKVNGVCLVFEFVTCSQLSFWIFNVFHYNWNFIITNVILSPPQFCYTKISLCVKCSYKKRRQRVQKCCYINAKKDWYIINIHKFIYK